MMLSIWKENIDCQPVLSCTLILKYIAKYAAKVEKWSEICTEILKRISITQKPDDSVMFTYHKFLFEVVVEHDIGAQETCHMSQKLPLIASSQEFVALNVGWKVLHQIIKEPKNVQIQPSDLHSYMIYIPTWITLLNLKHWV